MTDYEFFEKVRLARSAEEYQTKHLQAQLTTLCDALTEARAALDQARDWFQDYADSHTRKSDFDKAYRNQERSDFCARATMLAASPYAKGEK